MKPVCIFIRIVCFLFSLILLFHTSSLAWAQSIPPASHNAPLTNNLDADTLQLLESSLSLYELDQEIKRIADEEMTTQTRIKQLEKDLIKQEKDLIAAQKQSDRVLVAYYTGERDSLLGALLHSGSLSGMIAFYEYYRMIIDHDHDIMQNYQQQYQSMQHRKTILARTQSDLQQIGLRLHEQKNRIARLQSQIDSGLASVSDPATVQTLMEEMNQFWKNVGLYEVRDYFDTLARSMDQFPDFLKSQPDAVQISGRNYTITINEQQLNDYLHRQAQMPDSFQFVFTDHDIQITGAERNLNLRITGHYEVEQTPQNSIRFHIDELIFNELKLPDTTRLELENQFDLGFYPGQIIPYLKATGVTMSADTMQIQLQLSLN